MKKTISKDNLEVELRGAASAFTNVDLSKLNIVTVEVDHLKRVITIYDSVFIRGFGSFPYVFNFYTSLIKECLKKGWKLQVYNQTRLSIRKRDLDNVLSKLGMVKENDAWVFPNVSTRKVHTVVATIIMFAALVLLIANIINILQYGLSEINIALGIIFAITSIAAFFYVRLIKSNITYKIFSNKNFEDIIVCNYCFYKDSNKCSLCPER
jgi:hypothetical protein